jgi:DNA-binding beta-propeller fold protein YncE
MVTPGAGMATYQQPWSASGYGLVMAPNGSVVYATSELSPVACSAAIHDGSLWAIDVQAAFFDDLNSTPTYDEPMGLAITPDGTTLLVAGYGSGGTNPGITAYDSATLNQVGQPLPLAGLPQDIVVQP